MTAEFTGNSEQISQTLEDLVSALKARRAEIALEIEAARASETTERDAIITAPSAQVRDEMRAASIEADSLQTVAEEIERRIDVAQREVESERRKSARATALSDLRNFAQRWQANETAARTITEEVAAAVTKVPGLYESFEALVEDAAEITKTARVLGFEDADVPGLSEIKNVHGTLLFARLVDGIDEKNVVADVEMLIESTSRRARLVRQNALHARILGFGTTPKTAEVAPEVPKS